MPLNDDFSRYHNFAFAAIVRNPIVDGVFSTIDDTGLQPVPPSSKFIVTQTGLMITTLGGAALITL